MKRRLIIVLMLSVIAASSWENAAGQSPNDDSTDVENQQGQSAASKEVDPVVGRWQCSNSLQTRNLIVQADGQIIIEEPTMQTVHRNTWTRIDENHISVYGKAPFEITFDGPDSFTLLDVSLQTTATCQRQ